VTTKAKAAPAASDGHVPWENFVKFVRQLSHDLRNQLNAAELQSALIAELTNDAELKSEIRRLRELVSQLGATLQSLSASVAEPRPAALPYAAKDFVADIQKKVAHEFPEKAQAVKAAKEIMKMGPKYLIIKKGEHGALLFHQDNVFFAPALPLEEVFDPTGAGDTFAGGFIGHIARTRDISFDNMKSAIIVGSAMASFCVEKFGTTRLREITKAGLTRSHG